MIGLLIWLLVLLLVMVIVFYIVEMFPLDGKLKRIIVAIVALIFLLIILQRFVGFV